MISACLLVRDDAATLRACLESIRPHVDELIICDTGSIDDSPRIAREYADRFSVFLDCNDPATELIQDFALARNHALSLASGDAHFWADADDVVQGAEHLRSLADAMPPESIVLVGYDYQHDAAGRVVCHHWREQLVKPRDKFKWSIPVHEVLIPQGIQPSVTTTNLVKRVHRKELSVKAPDPERNLRILKAYVARVGEGDVRAWYYLGVEFSMRRDFPNALRVLKRYVELAGWSDERCLALLELARVYQEMGDFGTAIDWALRAMITKSWPEPYWTLVECFASLSDMGVDQDTNIRRAAHFAELGLSLPPTETVLFTNPMKRFAVMAILSKIYAHFGQIEQALGMTLEYLKTVPEDVDARVRALRYQDVLLKNSVVRDAQRLAAINSELSTHGQHDASQWGTLQTLMTQALGIAPQLPPATIRTIDPQLKADGCLDVVFLLGPQYEPWNPVTLAATGMGGSETMAWELAKRLRAIGHRVRIYAQAAPEQEGIFDGVEYLDTVSRANDEIRCDVAIVSRNPTLLDLKLTARLRLLWLHDVHAGDALTPARALRFDRTLALSQWHKDFLLNVYCEGQRALIARLSDSDVRVTRNGIEPCDFDANLPKRGETVHIDINWLPPERNPKRLIYSSSPDRGLQTLLEMWPAILKEEPEAELHVAYGFDNWKKSIDMGLRTEIPWLSPTAYRQIQHMIRSLPRVTSHGRLGPAKLTELQLSSGAWAYPTWFAETSCITAMQAQVAGCYIVTTPNAALNETVADRGILVRGAWEQGQVAGDAERAEFVRRVVNAIRGIDQPRTREELQAYAREHFSLDELAREWDSMLREELAGVEERVVPEWRE